MAYTFSEDDFQPLDAIALSWRWSSPAHMVLPESVRATIRALRPHAAARVVAEAASLCGDADGATATFSAAGDADDVRRQLTHLEIDGSEEVLVSWDARNALLMPWRTFCDWWEAFCYPSSDDMTIRPVTGRWVVCYDHDERFRYRSGR